MPPLPQRPNLVYEMEWWRPIPDPGDPAPYLRAWLLERVGVEEQGHLMRAGLTLMKASVQAQLEYLNVMEDMAAKYMK